MDTNFIVVSILFMTVCVALIVIILLQKKRSSLGSLSGSSGQKTYWSQNKGRSMEGNLEKYTKFLGILFFVLALTLLII